MSAARFTVLLLIRCWLEPLSQPAASSLAVVEPETNGKALVAELSVA